MALAKINGLFRLTRDIEMQYSAQGNAVGKLGLACSEKYKDKETQLFLDATVFSKPAEIIAQYAGTKGTQIYLSGKLQTDSWDDKQTGQKRYKTTMIIEGFDFVSGQENRHNQPQQAPQQNIQPGQTMSQGFVDGGRPVGGNQSKSQRPGQFQSPNNFDVDVPF